LPEEFKDYPREIDKSIEIPFHLREKTHTGNGRKNQKLAVRLRRSYRHLKKYKNYM